MKAPNQLITSRARVRARYALLPLDGVPASRFPSWPDCEARVLTSPAMGAEFVQCLIDIPASKGTTQPASAEETFGYILSGELELRAGDRSDSITANGFFFIPAQIPWSLSAISATRLLLIKKVFEPLRDSKVAPIKPCVGHQDTAPAVAFLGNDHTRLAKLLPDDIAFDIEMNVFTFDAGHGLPFVETHVMEHGLYMLEGNGLYFLDDEWMEVEAGDFIWMGPFCPQCFYVTGPTPAKYIYYKNVNREIRA